LHQIFSLIKLHAFSIFLIFIPFNSCNEILELQEVSFLNMYKKQAQQLVYLKITGFIDHSQYINIKALTTRPANN